MNNQPSQARWIFLVVLGYLVIAGLYAVCTPPWQAPDEPAHYNYIRALAEGGRIPVLQAGDYDQAYLEEIKARRFPVEMPIEGIRYESHQPPLYYLLATPVYLLTGGNLIALRFFSIALGAALVWVTYTLARLIFPGRADVALGGAAFVAFLPQHVAMSAAVNNDVPGELLLALAATLSLAYLRGNERDRGGGRLLAGLGVIIGLGFLTKTTAYLSLPLALLAVVMRGAGSRREWIARLALVVGPALVLGVPWWARNWLVYGPGDILGLQRHDLVVVGQPRSADWLAQMGPVPFFREMATTTFHSFWGQFGWMGVLMDSRIYLALGILSATAAIGCAMLGTAPQPMKMRAPSDFRPPASGFRLFSGQRRDVILLLAWLVLTVGAFGWYNLTFVQHQGRYLFPALPAWGICFALGWRQALQPRASRWLAGVWLAASIVVVGLGILGGDIDKWTLLLTGGTGVVLAANSVLPTRWRAWYANLVYVGLAGLSLLALFAFIVPQLRG